MRATAVLHRDAWHRRYRKPSATTDAEPTVQVESALSQSERRTDCALVCGRSAQSYCHCMGLAVGFDTRITTLPTPANAQAPD